jgi:hypothetical protein
VGRPGTIFANQVKLIFFPKHSLKQIRWRGRRARAALKWGPATLRRSPAIFGNAMPKSGSHLLTQILNGLVGLGPAVDSGFPPVNRDEANHPLPENVVLANLCRMRSGDIRYGYIHAREPYLSLLTAPGRATIFIYRDPRDMLVSHVFYATEMHTGHGMYAYYNERLSSMEERLNAAIEGITELGFELASVRQRYEAYIGWLDQPEVMCLRFEDLILEREVTLARLLGYFEVRGFDLSIPHPQAIKILKVAIAPKKSGTFRKGQPGDWREYFTAANKVRFKEIAGDILIRLGYEEGEDW